jgi:Tfp pilus assembly protein PilO
MAPLRRILSDYRGVVIVLAVLAALGLGGLFLGVYPMRQRLATADQQALQATNELRAARQLEASARRLVSGKDQAKRDLERFYVEILPSNQAAARRLAYLRVAKLAESSGLGVERRSIGIEHPKESLLAEMTMRMNLVGTYEDVRQFLYELETSEDFVVISGIQLAQRQRGEDTLQLELQVGTYFRTSDGK